jgi:O-antigen/teichoic acid export membrane protein
MIRRLADRLNLDLNYYLSGGALLLVDEAAIMIFGLVTTWCFSTYAPKGVYGSYGYIIAFVNMLGLIALPGLSQAIQRSSARNFDGVYLAAMRLRLAAGAVGSLALMGIACWLYFTGKGHLAKGALFAAALFPFSAAMDDYRSVLFGKQRFGVYVALHVAIQACVSAATILAILAGVQFPIILLANMTTRALGNGFSVLTMRRFVLKNDRVDPDFRRFGWNLSVIGVIGGISYYLDSVIVGSMLGLQTMAAYTLTFRLTEPIRSLGVFLNRLVFPRTVRVQGEAVARRFLSRTGWICLCLAAIGALGMWLLEPLMHLVFPRYPEAVRLTKWMMWSSLFAVPLIYLETFYLTQERFLRTYYWSATLRPALIIAALPYLTYRYGAMGAIWTKLVVRAGEASILYVKLMFDRRKLARERGGPAENAAPLGPLEFVRCPLCGETAAERLWSVPDRRSGLPGRFALARCNSCGLVRAQPRLTPDAVGRYDLNGRPAAAPPPLPRESEGRLRRRAAWVKHVTSGRPGPREIGWRQTLRRWPARWFGWTAGRRGCPLAYRVDGRRLLTLGVAPATRAELTALGWRVEAATARRMPEQGFGNFDAILAEDWLERAADPLAELRAARARLARGGVLAVISPLADGWFAQLAGSYWPAWNQPRAYATFTRAQLAAALRITGFHVAAVLDRSDPEAWRMGLDDWLADGSFGGWPRRVVRLIFGPRLLAHLARWADRLHRGDRGVILAVRDDAPPAGWAPREQRSGKTR